MKVKARIQNGCREMMDTDGPACCMTRLVLYSKVFNNRKERRS